MRPRSLEKPKEFHFKSQLEEFKAFGIHEPMSTQRVAVEKLAVKGCQSGTYFEFPQVTSSAKDELFIKEEFATKVLIKL